MSREDRRRRWGRKEGEEEKEEEEVSLPSTELDLSQEMAKKRSNANN